MPNKKFREVSPSELSYQALDTKNKSPLVNQFFIEGKGIITKPEMERAVAIAAQANPGLMLTLEGRWFWRYWAKNNKLPEVIEYTGAWLGDSSENADAINHAMNTRADALSTITLIDLKDNLPQQGLKNSGRDIDFKILFRTHHSICDGVGMIHWMKEVFRALRKQALQGSVSHLSEMTIVNQEQYPESIPQLQFSKPVFSTSQHPDHIGCHWIRNRWEITDKKIIPKLIFTLKSLAQEQHQVGDEPITTRFRIPSDLRRYLSKEEKQLNHISNLSGVLDLTFNGDEDVNDIHKALISAMRAKRDISVYPKKLARYAKWLPKIAFLPKKKYVENMHRQGNCNFTGIISYLGEVLLEDYSCDNFNALGAYGLPMPLEDKSVFIALVHYDDAFHSVISAPNALSNIELTTQFAKKLKERLNSV